MMIKPYLLELETITYIIFMKLSVHNIIFDFFKDIIYLYCFTVFTKKSY